MAFDKDKSLKLAEKYVQQGKIPAAVEEYRKISYADPKDLTILNTLGDLCARAGRTDEASLTFLRVAETYRDGGQISTAIAFYKKILKLDPANVEISLTLADLYVKQKLTIEARQQYQSVAEHYRRNGQVRQALRIMEKLAALEPENAMLRYEVAAGYHQEGLNTEALEMYVQAGQEFFRKGRDTEAIQAFQKALSINPGSKFARNLLVEALTRQGEVRTALGMLDYLVKQSPDDLDLQVLLGRTYVNAKMLESAEATFDRLVQRDPLRYDYLLEVARAYVERKQLDRALAVLDRCLNTILEQKEKKKATALLRTILKQDPKYLPALKLMANIYSRVREKKNLVTTLNLIVETALGQGLQSEASYALRQLMEIEPMESAHKTQLESLDGPPPVVEMTAEEMENQFPPGFESASALGQLQRTISTGGFSNPFAQGAASPPAPETFDEVSAGYSSELLETQVAQNPQFQNARLKLIEDMVAQDPNYIEARQKLKRMYLDADMKEKAALQALELARLHETKGDGDQAKELLNEAFSLNPSLINMMTQAKPVEPAETFAHFSPADVDQPSDESGTEVLLALMGIANRRLFERFLEREWRRAARSVTMLAVALIDIDYFKTFREVGGNQHADECLKRVVEVLSDELKRPGDLLASHEGDQLIAMLPETPIEGARIVAQKLLGRIRALNIEHQRSPKGRVTVSIGLAATVPQLKMSHDALVASAELALYQAQRAGGDQAVAGQTLM